MIKYICKVCGDSGIVPEDVIASPCCDNCGSAYVVLEVVESQDTRV